MRVTIGVTHCAPCFGYFRKGRKPRYHILFFLGEKKKDTKGLRFRGDKKTNKNKWQENWKNRMTLFCLFCSTCAGITKIMFIGLLVTISPDNQHLHSLVWWSST